MTDFTENATPPDFTKSRNSNAAVPIQNKPKFQSEFVPRDTEKSEFLNLADVVGVAISVDTTILHYGVATISRLPKMIGLF